MAARPDPYLRTLDRIAVALERAAAALERSNELKLEGLAAGRAAFAVTAEMQARQEAVIVAAVDAQERIANEIAPLPRKPAPVRILRPTKPNGRA